MSNDDKTSSPEPRVTVIEGNIDRLVVNTNFTVPHANRVAIARFGVLLGSSIAVGAIATLGMLAMIVKLVQP
jgi:hypothetical protein